MIVRFRWQRKEIGLLAEVAARLEHEHQCESILAYRGAKVRRNNELTKKNDRKSSVTVYA